MENKGKELELFIADLLSGVDKHTRPTKASGASTEIGDILNQYFIVECKYRGTDNISIRKRVWDKLCSEIPIGSKKIPLLCYRNQHRDTFAVLHIKDFIRLIKEVYKSENT